MNNNSNGGGDEEVTPLPEQIIQNPANREIVTVLGNLVVEARQHTIALQGLYEIARDLPGALPKRWIYQLVDEQERHIGRVNGHLAGVRNLFG